ncbi:MAG: thiol-disulfide oxidoreductase DCC family protein [Dehalococcoidia bacterium]
MTGRAIVLFDGVCNLCNASLDFILRHDSRGYFRFASLQSDAGRRLAREHGLDPERIDTVVLVEDGKAYLRSKAALRIARRLSGPYNAAYMLIAVPRPVRDFVYDRVARSRYRWFGKRDTCRAPTPEERDRLLDYEPAGEEVAA